MRVHQVLGNKTLWCVDINVFWFFFFLFLQYFLTLVTTGGKETLFTRTEEFKKGKK